MRSRSAWCAPRSGWSRARSCPASSAPSWSSTPSARQAGPRCALDSDRWIMVLLWLAVSVGMGLAARPVVNAALGATVPTFLAVLLAAVAVTNVADLARRRIDLAGVDLIGTLALRVFLAIAMLGL